VFPSWPNFPGADGARYSQFVATGERRPGQALWELLERAVADRGIDVHYASAAKELRIIDGRIGGADDLRSDAVILACGGFEGSDALKEAYLPLAPIFPVGHLANTGDGLLMAQRAGAGLWHMPAFFGWLAFRSLEHPAAFPIDFHGRSHLLVDGDGRRFSDETGWEAHDRVRALTVYLPRNHNHPHLPLYGICDAATLQAGPLNGIVGTPNDYRWSADNSAEVESRWIKRADSVAELATLLGLDSKTLANTLADFNQAAASGHDLQFNRSPDTLGGAGVPALRDRALARRRHDRRRTAPQRQGRSPGYQRRANQGPLRSRWHRLGLGPPHPARRRPDRRPRLRPDRRPSRCRRGSLTNPAARAV
jgi:hypothetical protein